MPHDKLEQEFEQKVWEQQQKVESALFQAEEAKGLGKRVSDVLMRMFAPFLWVLTTPIRWGIKWGIELLMDTVGKELTEVADPFLKRVEEQAETPEEVKALFKSIREMKGQASAVLGASATGAAVYSSIGMLMNAILLPFAYALNYYTRNVILTVPQAVIAKWRGIEAAEDYHTYASWAGYLDKDIDALEEITRPLLILLEIRELHLRGEIDDEEVNARLSMVGYSEENITQLKKLFAIIPPLPDMTRFSDFHAFDKDVIERWRDFYDAPEEVAEAFRLLGVFNEPPRDWANKYWFSHWRQPGRYELGELHRRGLISDDDARMAYRTMGYSEFWQDQLLRLVREVPTRVDVRRWWDMGTITEERLREIYHAQGYYEEDLEDYVLWTKVYVAFPDLVARFKNNWITIDEVLSELVELGMPEERAEELLETKFKKVVAPERVEEHKGLTRSLIIKGLKAEKLTYDEAVTLLMDLNYSEWEARYIINVELGMEGSPEIPMEFKQLTQEWRRAIGMEAKEIPTEVVEAERAFKEAERKLKIAIEHKAKQYQIDELETLKAEAGLRYRELLTLHGL